MTARGRDVTEERPDGRVQSDRMWLIQTLSNTTDSQTKHRTALSEPTLLACFNMLTDDFPVRAAAPQLSEEHFL